MALLLVTHLHSPIWVWLSHSNLPVHIRCAVSVQTVLKVKVPELANDDILPQVFGELVAIRTVTRVKLLDPLDVVEV